MAPVLPPPGFANASILLHTVAAGLRFGRIYLGTYSDPLGFSKTPSRFSDPRRRKFANRFGVLYLGDTVKVCFLEAVLRDQRDGVVGDLPIAESELYDRRPIVAKGSKQSLARKWAAAFNEHVSQVDGIIYPSRLNGHTNLAVFDRAMGKLKAVSTMKLIRAPGLADVLNDLNVAIVETDP